MDDRAVSFLLRWLKPQTSSRIGLRPHRTFELAMSYDDAYSAALEAVEITLGANVYGDDRAGRTIEAGFGLINNERIRVSFETGEDVTIVRVEAFFPAGARIPEKSAAVDALVHALQNTGRKA